MAAEANLAKANSSRRCEENDATTPSDRSRRAWVLVLSVATSFADAPAAPQPHSDQDIARFMHYAGPSATPNTLADWHDFFLLQSENRDFAVGPDGFLGYAYGFSRQKDAEQAALDACQDRLEAKGKSGTCQLYAVNLKIVYPGLEFQLPSVTYSVGDFAFNNEYFFHGPARAKGVIVWSHGYGGFYSDGPHSHAWSFINTFNLDGWDILRFDRDPWHDELWRSEEKLADSLRLLKDSGYRAIVLAGQSRGAVQSVKVLEHADVAALLAGIIAVSPANHGSSNDTTYLRAPGEWDEFLHDVPAGMRFAAVFFDHDAYVPAAKREADDTREILGNKHIANLAIFEDDPEIVTNAQGDKLGHFGAGKPKFQRKYADCLMAFIETGEKQGNCRQ